MVRIINIDTKARTIRVSNGDKELEWFTTDTGSHIPLKKGQSKAEAIKEHFGDKKATQQPGNTPLLDKAQQLEKYWAKQIKDTGGQGHTKAMLRDVKEITKGLQNIKSSADAEEVLQDAKTKLDWWKKTKEQLAGKGMTGIFVRDLEDMIEEIRKQHPAKKAEPVTKKTDKEEATYEYAKDKVALTGKQLMDKEGYSPVAYSGTIYKEDEQDFHPYYLAKGDGHHIKISKEEYQKLNEYRHERLKEWAKKMRGEV